MNNGHGAGGPRGRGRGSWQAQAESAPRELRRPHAAVQAATPGTGTEQPRGETFKLSADAKEWYPPNYVPQTQQTLTGLSSYSMEPAVNYGPRRSVQDRLHIHQALDPYNCGDMTNSLECIENADLHESVTNLINVMCEVTFYPGKFDLLCGPLVDTFASNLNDEFYTRLLVEAIVNQSINEPNFRYNGARLCSMYDSIAPPEESKFRSCLLKHCSAEENKIISGEEKCEEKMRGFAMFLAEIYTQLEDTQHRRVKSLGESLCKILLFLLDTKEQNNVKTVCQLLKLSGIALDADCPSGMHAAFERLQQLSSMPLVRTVLALRANRWGMQDAGLLRQHSDNMSNGEPTSPSSPNAPGGPNDSIYMPDGHTLTAEEKAFLQSHLSDSKSSMDDEDILAELDADNWETGMDPEMQEGFLEFLKISNQIKR